MKQAATYCFEQTISMKAFGYSLKVDLDFEREGELFFRYTSASSSYRLPPTFYNASAISLFLSLSISVFLSLAHTLSVFYRFLPFFASPPSMMFCYVV